MILFTTAEAKRAFQNRYILKWSFWVWVSTCANVQAGNYIQVLWEEVLPSTKDDDVSIYNGAVHGATTLAGALAVFAVGFVKLDWAKFGDLAVALVSVTVAAFLAWMSQTGTIWVAYAGRARNAFKFTKEMLVNQVACM